MTGLKALTYPECEIILECLKFISEGGRFVMEADCSPRIGLSIEEFHKVVSECPDVIDDVGTDAFLAISNSLNEVCYGPDSPAEQEWSMYFSAPQKEIEAIFEKWTKSFGMDYTGIK